MECHLPATKLECDRRSRAFNDSAACCLEHGLDARPLNVAVDGVREQFLQGLAVGSVHGQDDSIMLLMCNHLVAGPPAPVFAEPRRWRRGARSGMGRASDDEPLALELPMRPRVASTNGPRTGSWSTVRTGLCTTVGHGELHRCFRPSVCRDSFSGSRSGSPPQRLRPITSGASPNAATPTCARC
jgi:hypothetical protein